MQSPNRYSQVCMINNKSFIHCCFTTLFVVTVFSQGCAARPDLVKLQQEVKQEKHDQAKASGELREEIDHLMDFQSELVKKQQILSRQQVALSKEVMLLYVQPLLLLKVHSMMRMILLMIVVIQMVLDTSHSHGMVVALQQK